MQLNRVSNPLFEESFNVLVLGFLIVIPVTNILLLQNKELFTAAGIGEWTTPFLIMSSIAGYVGSLVLLIRSGLELGVQTDFEAKDKLVYVGACLVTLINLAGMFLFLDPAVSVLIGIIAPVGLCIPLLLRR